MELRPYPRVPDRYLVNDSGEIFSLLNNFRKPREKPFKLSPHFGQGGYLFVGIHGRMDRHACRMAVHTVVCETFHGLRPSAQHEVAHTDGDKLNNAASNLRWATRKENAADRTRHNRTVWGEASVSAKLNTSAVQCIKLLSQEGISVATIAKAFRVSTMSIYKVLAGKSWVDPASK